jgi:hypothetical protein
MMYCGYMLIIFGVDRFANDGSWMEVGKLLRRAIDGRQQRDIL